MGFNNSSIIIGGALVLALYLIYSQDQQRSINPRMIHRTDGPCDCMGCQMMRRAQGAPSDYMGGPNGMGQMGPNPMGQMGPMGPNQMGPNPMSPMGPNQMGPMGPNPMGPMGPNPMAPMNPNPINITLKSGEPTDPYSDAIKKQDLYTMYDPLTYPQLRLPREVLERYNEYYKATGTYPPFNEATQPFLFDNPILNGYLVKTTVENEPFVESIPTTVPLYRVRSSTNSNRYFYYVIDNRNFNMLLQPKIPLDNVKVNGVRIQNADFYGLPELFDNDMLEDINIYPGAKFKVNLYKTYHFP